MVMINIRLQYQAKNNWKRMTQEARHIKITNDHMHYGLWLHEKWGVYV